MNDPFADDGWDELTRELGVEKSPPAAEPVEEDPALGQEYAESESSEGDEFDAGLESEGDAPDGAETPEEGPQEPGKKRRRRRRRRKGKGPGEGGEVGEVAPEAEAAPVAAAAEPEYSDNEYATDTDSDELVAAPVGVEEDTAGEVLRELIATWNVPSWDSIITGLHRPER